MFFCSMDQYGVCPEVLLTAQTVQSFTSSALHQHSQSNPVKPLYTPGSIGSEGPGCAGICSVTYTSWGPGSKVVREPFFSIKRAEVLGSRRQGHCTSHQNVDLVVRRGGTKNKPAHTGEKTHYVAQFHLGCLLRCSSIRDPCRNQIPPIHPYIYCFG